MQNITEIRIKKIKLVKDSDKKYETWLGIYKNLPRILSRSHGSESQSRHQWHLSYQKGNFKNSHVNRMQSSACVNSVLVCFCATLLVTVGSFSFPRKFIIQLLLKGCLIETFCFIIWKDNFTNFQVIFTYFFMSFEPAIYSPIFLKKSP